MIDKVLNINVTQEEINSLHNDNLSTYLSYKYTHDFRILLYKFVKYYKPKVIVELGTGNGLLSIVMALSLKNSKIKGNVYTYDIFEGKNERYFASDMKINKDLFNKYEVDNFISMKKLDIWEWLKSPFEFDLLYIDINNTNEKLDKILKNPFIRENITNKKIILYEGNERLKRNDSININEGRINLSILKGCL